MRLKKILAIMLASMVIASMSACGDDNEPENTGGTAETTTTAATTEKKEEETTVPVNDSSAESVMVYYGWGGSEDEAKYTTEIFCPEGAKFSENTLEIYEEDGSVMTVEVDDEVNEYSATGNMHWHRDAYNSEPVAYPIIAQLYFDGEVDAETAAENSNCSQNVTPLGFKWNGYDVILIETKYTFKDYGETTELFAGVEYDLDYWKVEEGTGEIKNLTTKALFGFDMYSYGWDDLTREKCAWIAGELFGIDSGITNPFSATNEETTEAIVNVDNSAIVGKWVDIESDWEDTYIFNADGTGVYISGPEYPFTYSVDVNTLTVVYAEDDTESFTITADSNKIVLADKFNYEQSFEKSVDETETSTGTETTASDDTNEPDSKPEIIGTWKESETGIDETFTFNADGTGKYSCLYDGEAYECGFTYEFLRSDYVDIYYDDNTEGGFQFEITDNKMTVRNEYVEGLAYTRQ